MARKLSPYRVPVATLLPRQALLAIAVVVDVALQMEGRPISAKSVAGHHGVAPRSLEKMLQSLVHDGILESSRGPQGGYELARDHNAVTLNDILRAVGVGGEEEEPQSEILTDIVLPALSPAEQAFEQALNQISLDDLVGYADRVGTKKA
jgi:Rrf2 family transcriptional regulator, iron-sulfur cluster assembly transcription factor